jgi:putative membrane protein insertion efficiency factor
MGQINYYLCRLISFIIMFYQFFISPMIKPSCRFYPSCSNYALSAINIYGIFKGTKLTVCRLLRCHPWSEGGYDPIPVVLKKEKP